MQASQVPQQVEGLLQVQLNRYQIANNEYSGLLSAIEERLHKILNRQSPEKSAESKPVNVNDFISAMDMESDKLNINNSRLQRLLNHLNELV